MIKIKLMVLPLALLGCVGLSLVLGNSRAAQPVQPPAGNPALNVAVTQPELREIPLMLSANGSIAAWQEAIIGAEIGDLRLKQVSVQVGETVKKGQVLAEFTDESVLADVAQSRASLAEAQANLAAAKVDAERANRIASAGAISAQQIDQYRTGEKTASAKVQVAKAQLDSQLLRLKYTKVLASDDGVISSRSATLGAVAVKGQELFRLIRQNRLEWQAEVTAAEMAQLKPGMKVNVDVPEVGRCAGVIRYIAPTLNVQSRNGLVYVDLPNAAEAGMRTGMFAHGEFNLGVSRVLTIPQAAMVLRDGFSYVYRLTDQNGDRAQVNQVKIQLGRRAGERLEIISGLVAEDRIVAGGAAFLADGDSVRVVPQ